jgi:hypothetical protein
MPHVGWTYVGHWMEVADPGPKGEARAQGPRGDRGRSLVTTFRDRDRALDNPGEVAVDDTLFGANYMLLPKGGTPVRVIFRSPTSAERAEISALDKKMADEPKVKFREGHSREEQKK